MSYSSLFKRAVPVFNNLVGGFILFVAVNEVIAVPFMLLHLSFTHYMIVFVVVNFSVLLYGTNKFVFEKLPAINKDKIRSPMFILFGLLLATTIVIVQTQAHYAADDSIYVSLVEQNRGSEVLYSVDPATGYKDNLLSKSYRFQGWELTESALSEVFRLPTTEVVRRLIPMVVILSVVSAFRLIFSELLEKKDVYLALVLWLVMMLFSGFSSRSPGAFFMTRQWHGKAILAILAIPMLTLLLFKLSKTAKQGADKKIVVSIFVVNLASISLNPTSIFLNLSAMGAFGFILVLRLRSPKIIAALAAASLPFLPVIVFTLINSSSRGGARLAIDSFGGYLGNYVGDPWYFIVCALGMVIFYNSGAMKKNRTLFYSYPLILVLTALNPLLQPILSDKVTSTAYWRLFWLAPLYMVVPVIGVLTYNLISAKIAPVEGKYNSIKKISILFFVIVGFMLCGRYVFAEELNFTEYNTSRSKTPVGVAEVSNFIASQPEGTVIAAKYPAIYIHNFTSSHHVLIPRGLSIRVHHKKYSEDYVIKSELLDLMNRPQRRDYFSIGRFYEEIRRYEVDYVVYGLDNEYIGDYVRRYNPEEIYRNQQYAVFKVIPVDQHLEY